MLRMLGTQQVDRLFPQAPSILFQVPGRAADVAQEGRACDGVRDQLAIEILGTPANEDIAEIEDYGLYAHENLPYW